MSTEPTLSAATLTDKFHINDTKCDVFYNKLVLHSGKLESEQEHCTRYQCSSVGGHHFT